MQHRHRHRPLLSRQGLSGRRDGLVMTSLMIDLMATAAGVFVTGATGSVGSAVADSLVDRGQLVVAAVREDGAATRVPFGAIPRAFDFGVSPRRLDLALAGCDRLFLMRPPAIEDVRTFL